MFKIEVFKKVNLEEKENKVREMINQFEDDFFNMQSLADFEDVDAKMYDDDDIATAYKLIDLLEDYSAALSSYILAIKEGDEYNKDYYFEGICKISRDITKLINKDLFFENEITDEILKTIREEI